MRAFLGRIRRRFRMMFGRDGNEFASDAWSKTTDAAWNDTYTPQNLSSYDEGRPRK
jgi:hypothetical protein